MMAIKSEGATSEKLELGTRNGKAKRCFRCCVKNYHKIDAKRWLPASVKHECLWKTNNNKKIVRLGAMNEDAYA